ncbi:MAG: glycosyltransferase family 4 protein [Candidatus Omnitrophica bacterium]|nr:glycosyltransferase family 4 protein [Candidatus Omnitrophota bacterium]
MQTQSLEFFQNLSKRHRVYLIHWGYSQVFLLLFFIIAFIRASFRLLFFKIDIIQLGDIVLSPLGVLLKFLFNKPVIAVSHGKDSAYSNILYNSLVLGAAKKLDSIICVSSHVKEKLKARGLQEAALTVIPNGINESGIAGKRIAREEAIGILSRSFNLDLKGKKVLLAAARLVPKKGIAEFVENIFGLIKKETKEVVFLIAGAGPQKQRIVEVVKRRGLSDAVFLLGNIEHESLHYHALFAIADVLVMPNISVNNDAEGFGMVILEAAVEGVPVVAFAVDGVNQTIQNHKNGVLIPQDDNEGFAQAVTSLLVSEEAREGLIVKAKKFVFENFSWSSIVTRYEDEYQRLIALWLSKK